MNTQIIALWLIFHLSIPVSDTCLGSVPCSRFQAEEANQSLRENATFVTLARNREVWSIANSIRQVEDRFNHAYNYDWVFLNDEPFDETFINITSSLISGQARYGQVPKDHWSFPDFIDQNRAAQTREDMKAIYYGSSESYRHMCRYESGFFFQHPLMMEYQYYWRVEPGIQLYCDLPYDPFKLMREEKKKYSFVISLHEIVETVTTLWNATKEFVKEHPEHIAENNSLGFLSDDGGETWNYCHFWSNFEIGSLEWLRSKPYLDFFDHLDKQGGFFYERWGDAPVHSIAASLFLAKDEIHFFDDIAYFHSPFEHCPMTEERRTDLDCNCSPEDPSSVDWVDYSCTSPWLQLNGLPVPEH